MSTKVQMRALLAVGALSLASASWGCVADRPSRNGVFDENQYIRKDFLVRPGDSETPDRGWLVSATITSASEPNVFGDTDYFGLSAGSQSSGALVHFDITNDKVSLLNSREISNSSASGFTTGRQPEVINAWAATNVDLKYRVNLDGEKTNFYEENQELDWQQRQWVKLNLDKNDMSDLAPLGQYYNAAVAKCADESNASATLVTDSFVVDETNDVMSWAVQVTLPIKYDDADCMTAMGSNGLAAQRLGREYQTATIQYSFMRAAAAPTYSPLVLGEHDSIRRKYGALTFAAENIDVSTGLAGAQEYALRYDPTQPIDWYFEEGFPDQYKNIFTSHNLPSGVPVLPSTTPTIEDATNAVLAKSGVAARVAFHEWNVPDAQGNPTNHAYGDIRYNMLRFVQTFNQQPYAAGITTPVIDPRNGQIISNHIVFSNFAIQDLYTARIDAYLQTIGASPGLITSWPDNPTDPNDPTKTLSCTPAFVGAAAPIIPATLIANHDGNSTLYQKMQGYLYRPSTSDGPLGPSDFVAQHQSATDPTKEDTDFYHAYFTYIPYLIYTDPNLNQFVTPEGGSADTDNTSALAASSTIWSQTAQETQFHALTSMIDQGQAPYVSTGSGGSAAQAFTAQLKAYSLNHRALNQTKAAIRFSGADMPVANADSVTDFAMETVMQRDARHCILAADGTAHWETQQEWQNSLVYTYWSQVAWHEFGHAMGLDHNFMGSVDKNNFPTYSYTDPSTNATVTRPTLYSSSVMEYGAPADRVFWGAGWGPYDQGALAFIYSNNTGTRSTAAAPTGATLQTQSGQYSNTYPWNDPLGFSADGKTETQFLTCNATHIKYTPLCRMGDLGVTPSEIMANDIEDYEWQYTWRNFRQYHKYWDLSNYGDTVLDFITEQRRFMSLWSFDFGASEIASKLQTLGIVQPAGAPSLSTYFAQLTDKFTDEMSAQGQLMAAFHNAVIQQSSGQRPYLTTYDNFFGDVTQQGIGLDKLFALQSWLALWPIDNYDPTQAQGLYEFMNTPYGLADDVNGVANGSSYFTVANQTTFSMLGAFDSFAYYKEAAVQEYTWDTHSNNFFSENQSAQVGLAYVNTDWAGSKQFIGVRAFLDFWQNLAEQYEFKSPAGVGDVPIDCSQEAAGGQGESYQLCNYDPRNQRGVPAELWYSNVNGEFVGPDGKNYIWSYIPDRDQYIIADRDRNIATYNVMFTYNNDLSQAYDDGTGAGTGSVYVDEQSVKYFSDYYQIALMTPH